MSIIVHPKYPEIVGVRSVCLLTDFKVHVVFTDGSERDIDLEQYLCGPVFDPIRSDPRVFAQVFVDPIGQTLAWPNGADIAPETLYYGDQPVPWAQDETRQPKPQRERVRRSRAVARPRTKRRTRAVA